MEVVATAISKIFLTLETTIGCSLPTLLTMDIGRLPWRSVSVSESKESKYLEVSAGNIRQLARGLRQRLNHEPPHHNLRSVIAFHDGQKNNEFDDRGEEERRHFGEEGGVLCDDIEEEGRERERVCV